MFESFYSIFNLMFKPSFSFVLEVKGMHLCNPWEINLFYFYHPLPCFGDLSSSLNHSSSHYLPIFVKLVYHLWICLEKCVCALSFEFTWSSFFLKYWIACDSYLLEIIWCHANLLWSLVNIPLLIQHGDKKGEIVL